MNTKLPIYEEGVSVSPPLAASSARRQIVGKYRSKVTRHLSMLIKRSPAVAKQFIPDDRELVEYGGTESPFEEGKNNHGIYGLERVYADRAVITPYFECGAYCRYCFKKTRTLAGEAKRMTDEDVARALAYIRADSRIKTALITGGDPMMDLDLLKQVLDGLIEIPHVSSIRLGTRNILFNPAQINDEIADWLAGYTYIDYQKIENSRTLSIGFSLNHADEISPEVARAVHTLTRRGIVVRGQVTLLKGINDSVKDIRELYELFSKINIVPYYLYHCMPVVGGFHYRTTVQKGLDILHALSARTGAIAPTYTYVTQIGKHRLAPGVPLDYNYIQGKRYLRATTPYKADEFLEYTGKSQLPPLHTKNEAGYIVSHYMDGED